MSSELESSPRARSEPTLQSLRQPISWKSFPAVLVMLLALNLVVRLAVILRPLDEVDNLTIPDDAYLSLQIARNIAHGLGPWYSVGYTSGFQPLYTLLAVPLFWVFPSDPLPPLRGALLLLALFDTATLFVLSRWIRRLAGSDIALIVAVGWIFNYYVVGTTLNGLETSVSMFFIVAAFAACDGLLTDPVATLSGRRLALFGGVLGLGILARIDNTILTAVLVAGLVWRLSRDGVNVRDIVRYLGAVSVGMALVDVPWFLYSFHYTGDLFPISGKAVRYMTLAQVRDAPTFETFYWPNVSYAFRRIYRRNEILIWAVALSALLGVLLRFARRTGESAVSDGQPDHRRARLFVLAFAHSAIMFCAYCFYIFAPWYFERYLYPLVLLLLLALAILLRWVFLLAGSGVSRPLAAGFAALALAGALVSQSKFRELFAPQPKPWGYMNLGLWARAHFQPGTVIGSSQTGALGYFADQVTVVNLDGVVNKACFEALQHHRNMDYIRATKVQYLVNWPENMDFLRLHSTGYKDSDVTLVTTIEDFRTWMKTWQVYRVNP